MIYLLYLVSLFHLKEFWDSMSNRNINCFEQHPAKSCLPPKKFVSFYWVLLGLCRVLGAFNKYAESSTSEEEVAAVGNKQHQLHRNSLDRGRRIYGACVLARWRRIYDRGILVRTDMSCMCTPADGPHNVSVYIKTYLSYMLNCNGISPMIVQIVKARLINLKIVIVQIQLTVSISKIPLHLILLSLQIATKYPVAAKCDARSNFVSTKPMKLNQYWPHHNFP